MGGGQQAQAPQYDPTQSTQATRDQLQAQYDFMAPMARLAGQLSNEQDRRNIASTVNLLRNPAGIYSARIKDLERDSYVNPHNKEDNDKAIAQLQGRDPVADIRAAYSDAYATAGNLETLMRRQASESGEYQRVQSALRQGVDPRLSREVTPDAAAVGKARDVAAGQVRAGGLGDALMTQAMQRAQSDGRLSREASRDAVQAARSGMAARGMATGNAGLAAELLNRDRYARARQSEDLAFAQGVQGQDLGRQFNNVANRLRADLANQGADQARNLAISQNRQQSNVIGAQLAQANNQFNAGQRTAADLQNIAYLQAGSALANQEGARRMGTLQDLYNFQFSTDPRSVMLGMGTPFSNMSMQGAQMAGNAQFTPMYSGGQFSNSGGMGNLGMAAGGALSGAAAGAMLGSVVPGIGTAAGAIGGALLGGAGGYLSDEREKTDIKPLGTLSNVLKIPAYQYRYKGEKKKRKGVMAQDVQKVLPEAVAEVDYKGKKRLAIKPAVIGAALAQELTEQSKAVAA